MANLASRYGSCRRIPEFMLHTGSSSFDYPQWHIEFLKGNLPKGTPLDRRVKKLLDLLSDGAWHEQLPNGIGFGTFEACDDLGLMEIKKIESKVEDESISVKFRITSVGKEVLKRNALLPKQYIS